MDMHIGQREFLLEMMTCEYVIPDPLRECVKDAIRMHATSNLSEATIDDMVTRPQSLAGSLHLLREGNLSYFRGKFAEWLACVEYNALKNKGNVHLTIINPDPSSKADLLHIIKIHGHYECIPGPDIKCGEVRYVLDQYEKIVENRIEIPMVDMDGALTSEEGLHMLTPGQRARFEQLCERHPRKRPVPSTWTNQDITRLMLDYLKYVDTDATPADPGQAPFEDSKQNRERIREKLFNVERPLMQSNWDEFRVKSVSLQTIEEDYLCTATTVKLTRRQKEQQERDCVASPNEQKQPSERINAKPPPAKDAPPPRAQKPITMANKVAQLAAKVKVGIADAKDALVDQMDDLATRSGYESTSQMLKVKGVEFLQLMIDIVPDTIEAYRNEMRAQKTAHRYSTYAETSTSIPSKKTQSKPPTPGQTPCTDVPATTNNPSADQIQTVQPHTQRYRTKKGVIFKEKKAYNRGRRSKKLIKKP